MFWNRDQVMSSRAFLPLGGRPPPLQPCGCGLAGRWAVPFLFQRLFYFFIFYFHFLQKKYIFDLKFTEIYPGHPAAGRPAPGRPAAGRQGVLCKKFYKKFARRSLIDSAFPGAATATTDRSVDDAFASRLEI